MKDLERCGPAGSFRCSFMVWSRRGNCKHESDSLPKSQHAAVYALNYKSFGRSTLRDDEWLIDNVQHRMGFAVYQILFHQTVANLNQKASATHKYPKTLNELIFSVFILMYRCKSLGHDNSSPSVWHAFRYIIRYIHLLPYQHWKLIKPHIKPHTTP